MASRPTAPIIARPYRLVLLIAFFHFSMTIAAIVLSFGRSLDRFDDGTLPTMVDHVLGMVETALIFPLGSLAMRWPQLFPGLEGYLPILVNSLIWSVILTALWRFIRRPDDVRSD